MSTVPDKELACPGTSEPAQTDLTKDEVCEGIGEKKSKKTRNVCFPDDGELVTQYFEPANPWQHVPSTTRAQLAAEYLESCRRHNTPPIDTVLQQIRELPENSIGGGTRAPRLSLAECCLCGAAAVDALESLLRRVQFRRLEVDHALIDDEGAEALFDMIEYYESANVVCISGPRHFGIRGWQAASRMIKKSAELSELEITEGDLEASHAPVLARALRPHTCRLRSLCLQRALLCGEPLLCLVIALKSNSSVRELRLGDNNLTVSDAAQLASLLRLNTNIHLLDLSNNQIQDAGAGHLAEALLEQAAQTPPSVATSPMSPHNCPLTGGHETRGLAFLVLWNNQLTRNCAQHLSKALRSSQSLCVLNVGRNALGGDTVRALQGSGRLISLGLQAARLGPEAARAIADLIRHDKTLQRLDLRDNRLGSSGLQAILNAMTENTTLTQIDLDDPAESPPSEDVEQSTVARLTREIRALCRRNEPDATSPERRVHRKISLTCNTTCLVKTPLSGEEERRWSRLRSPLPSPAPSPAGSPVPLQHHSRFSVTRVTPERDSSTDSSSPSTPTRPTYCPTPSRFKVVQVAEPPQIQIHPASEPRKSLSRFSVTRNYDKIYNPSPSPVPSSGSDTPGDDYEENVKSVTSGMLKIQSNIGVAKENALSVHTGKYSDVKSDNIVSLESASKDLQSVTKGCQSVVKDTQSISKDSRSVSKDSSDKQTQSANSSVSAVKVQDSKQNNRFKVSKSDKRFRVSPVEKGECSRDKKKFSASNVTETEKEIVDNTNISSHSDMISSNKAKYPISAIITPVDSKIKASENVIEDTRESSDLKVSSVNSIHTPIAKSKLKSCIRNPDSKCKTPKSEIKLSRRESENEVLISHPNLKSVSDLFKSLELYDNTADNTVSLTSLTETKRPSIRDLFNVTDNSSVSIDTSNQSKVRKDDNSEVGNESTYVVGNIIMGNIPVQSGSEITGVTNDPYMKGVATCTDDDCNHIKSAANDESHQTERSIETNDLHQNVSCETAIDLISKSSEISPSKRSLTTVKGSQNDIVMDVCIQTDDFEKDYDEDLPNLEYTRTFCQKHAQNQVRSDSEDVFKIIDERNKTHDIYEDFIYPPKAESIVSTDLVKKVSDHTHVGSTSHELSPGNTPHPSKGVKTFMMPVIYIEDSKDLENIDNSKNETVDKVVEKQTDMEIVVIKNDLIEHAYAPEEEDFSIDDEYPVFDSLPRELPQKDINTIKKTNITDIVHIALEKGSVDTANIVPELEPSVSIKVLETDIQPNIPSLSQDCNKDFMDLVQLSENVMPTFLPDKKVFLNETKSNIDLQPNLISSMEEKSSQICDVLISNISPEFSNVADVELDKLPGATEPIIVSKIPIYSISNVTSLPGTSKTVHPRNVKTQTDISDCSPDLPESFVFLDTIDLTNLPGSVANTPRHVTRLDQTERDFTNLAGISKQIEITPRQTELSITVSKLKSVLENTDFSSMINADTDIELQIEKFLEEIKGNQKTTSIIEEATLDNTQTVTETLSIEEIFTDSDSRFKDTLIEKNQNLKEEDSSVVKHLSRPVEKPNQIHKTVDHQNISDTSKLIHTDFEDLSESRSVENSILYINNSASANTVESASSKELIDDKKIILDPNPYKDVSEVLTHSETKNAGVIKSETQLTRNTVEVTDEEKIDIELKMTVRKENLENKTVNIKKVVKKEDALKQIELITKDLGDLIDEMKIGTGDRVKKEYVRVKKVEVETEESKNESNKSTYDAKRIDIFDTERIIKQDNIFIDQVKRDKETSTDDDLIIDSKEVHRIESQICIASRRETEYNKYLRGSDVNFDDRGLVKVTIEGNKELQRHIETERHRKESVIDRRQTDHRKEDISKHKGVNKESVLKKNKSESSLDSSDMEVSRLMTKHINPFCDSSSSLEISGSSIESLTEPKLKITKDNVDSDMELDRRKEHTLSTGSSVESTEVTPMNTNLLHMSMSSNESVSPIFGKNKNIRDSLSSLEASVSSLESNRQDRVMVTSADSGIEHSLPKDIHDSSSNEGTLTNQLNFKHDTLTASPKRASSLLDVPALKSKGLDRMRKISWVAPSPSFNVARQDDKETKPSHLEKLLSLFQHPSSIFSRSTEEEKKISTTPKKDSLLTSSFWSWGSGERDKDDSSEATDSTLSERVQVSFIDESFSKKLDSKTPSTDTENTLSEFQTFTQSEKEYENVDTCIVTLNTTDKSEVQIDLSLKCTEANNGNKKFSDSLNIVSPNDFNKNHDSNESDKNLENSPEITEQDVRRDDKLDLIRPRSFAAVLKASGSENSLDKQNSPEGQPVDKLPSKIIRGIKENISPENTLTSSMSNTKALASELTERQLKNQIVVNSVWDVTNPLLEKGEEKADLAPIATIEETCDETADIIQLAYIDDDKSQKEVDVAKDALSYLMYENQDFTPTAHETEETPGQSSLADELKEAEIKQMFDLSPELVIDEAIEVPEVFTAKDVKGIRTSPIIPERAKLKKSNSLEDLSSEGEKNPKAKTIVFKVPESKPRDIPERSKLRSRTGSSPKSLPESLNKPCPLNRIHESKKKKVSSLGKMAKDSLLALNMSEDEIAEFRRSYKLTSVESLRSLESVSEDANSQSGNSVDSRCRACLRTSQESLMSLDSITEDVCRCNDSEKPGKSHR